MSHKTLEGNYRPRDECGAVEYEVSSAGWMYFRGEGTYDEVDLRDFIQFLESCLTYMEKKHEPSTN